MNNDDGKFQESNNLEAFNPPESWTFPWSLFIVIIYLSSTVKYYVLKLNCCTLSADCIGSKLNLDVCWPLKRSSIKDNLLMWCIWLIFDSHWFFVFTLSMMLMCWIADYFVIYMLSYGPWDWLLVLGFIEIIFFTVVTTLIAGFMVKFVLFIRFLPLSFLLYFAISLTVLSIS